MNMPKSRDMQAKNAINRKVNFQWHFGIVTVNGTEQLRTGYSLTAFRFDSTIRIAAQ